MRGIMLQLGVANMGFVLDLLHQVLCILHQKKAWSRIETFTLDIESVAMKTLKRLFFVGTFG